MVKLKTSEGDSLTRWVFLDKETNKIVQSNSYVCVAGLSRSRYWTDNHAFGLVYNGESPANSRAEGLPFKGGELSEKWLKFLLGPESPFPEAAACVVNKDDIEGINKDHGFIFDGHMEVGSGQLRGLMIASRYAQEFNSRSKNWASMVDDLGIDPLIAWILSTGYVFGKGWIISNESQAGHTVFYEPFALYLPNLMKRQFPYDKPLKNGVLKECTSSLYESSFENPVYNAYHNGWGLKADERRDVLYYGVEPGDNAVEASKKILAGIEKVNANG